MTVWDPRVVKPLDEALVDDARPTPSWSPSRTACATAASAPPLADELRRRSDGGGPKVAVLGVPDRYIPHGKPDVILAQLGLDAAGIAGSARALL